MGLYLLARSTEFTFDSDVREYATDLAIAVSSVNLKWLTSSGKNICGCNNIEGGGQFLAMKL